MTNKNPQKIVVLGAGMASLSAVFELTNDVNWQQHYDIRVYQLGWRLGGKGASSRNISMNQRIEEHGLHILMGFYHNSFKLIRKCYQELNKAGDLLIDWEDAFVVNNIGAFQEYFNGNIHEWIFDFPENKLKPGDDINCEDFSPKNYIKLLIKFANDQVTDLLEFDSLTFVHEEVIDNNEAKILSFLEDIKISHKDKSELDIVCQILETEWESEFDLMINRSIIYLLKRFSKKCFKLTEKLINKHHKFRHAWIFIDLICTIITGMIEDTVIINGFDIIDKYDLREWLAKHSASETTIFSAPVRGIYNLVFAYEEGLSENPNLSAGVALRSILRMMFNYKGSIFWKMRAGTADTIFAPLYLLLRKRGVKFMFFHRIKELKLSEDCQEIASIEITQQATLKYNDYYPLVKFGNYFCFPNTPLFDQIENGNELLSQDIDFESSWKHNESKSSKRISLNKEIDYDIVILGISLGEIKYICRDLIDKKRIWQRLIQEVKTVPTLFLQIWVKSKLSIGSPLLDLCEYPLNTYANMSHLLPEENHEVNKNNSFLSLIYLCGTLAKTYDYLNFSDIDFFENQVFQAKKIIFQWIENYMYLLCGESESRWKDEFAKVFETLKIDQTINNNIFFYQQFWNANLEPTDSYVLSVKGSTDARIMPNMSGLTNLYLAGDWTKNGLNVGCLEAAVMSGMQVSRAICCSPKYVVGETDLKEIYL